MPTHTRGRLVRLTAASASLAVAAALTGGPAQAAPKVSDPIAEGLVTPLQLEVHRGKVYVAQAFAGTISRVRRDGSVKNLVQEKPGTSIGGIAVRGKKLFYTINADEGKQRSQLKVRKPSGKTKKVANLQRFEEHHNPDAVNSYGFSEVPEGCEIPEDFGGPEPYAGIVDTNPYAIARAGKKGWYVADAGANAIFHVTKGGRVSTASVLPPQPAVEITAEVAEEVGLPPECAGTMYVAEPVPTDVEVAENGDLYVSLLPGGPESPVLGARGAVVRIAAGSGAIQTVARGFLAATNVALDDKGRVYVTELFGGKVSIVKSGQPRPYVELPMPGAVEFSRGALYVATNVLDEETGGSIVKVRR